ncbi:CobW family GTP-binding protein [Vibrio genomosp. F10]|uniref:CobW family GTP-binding protein n=1 Tax=Vibrio genomosp. F10 TaxID=723171 RepID=UPI0002D95339|nr:GTP-binding protein [Vibrio genomosp. F10]OEF05498.1 cobalamin biosynthesis protein P47K [Vibrio genomosp. F10 str. 9ZB36]
MSSNQSPIRSVPTNIITGFLGVGKTSAILNLMRHKPADERWAVLVNEFGEIGVDGSIIQGQYNEEKKVFIREVPGGCMCCAAGLPMQIALAQLLSEAKPDRLLIEPTGLGHPKEVLQVLLSTHYREVLSLQKTLTLVDARKLSDSRYTRHDTFNQQISIADTVVGNKVDLYQDSDKKRLIDYVKQHGQPSTHVLFSQHGEIAWEEFVGETVFGSFRSHQHDNQHKHEHQHSHSHARPLVSDTPIPESGFIKAKNQGEGFQSIGWRFSPSKVFSRQKLASLLVGLRVERMKAVFITDLGVFAYNLTGDDLTEVELDDCLESRIEMISDQMNDSLEDQLLACVL